MEPRTPSLTSTPSPLLPYQKEAGRHIIEAGGSGGLFLAMGTGKTRLALALARRYRAQRVLVVGPNSPVFAVWQREAALIWPDLYVRLLSAPSVRKKALQLLAYTNSPQLVYVNYESYWREPLRKEILKWAPDMVIYDEAHRLKGRGTRQARFAHLLADRVPYRLGLTGTPMPNGPQDVFSVMKALVPGCFGGRYADFERAYIIKGGYMMYQITGYRNMDDFQRRLARCSYRITKEEALDLPEQVDVVLPIALSTETRRVYDQMASDAIAEIEGVDDKGQPRKGVALARIVLTNVLRLQQIASGFTRLDDGVTYVEFGNEKLAVLKDLLEDALPQTGRVVVFCRFRKDVERVAKMTAELAPTFVLDGRVPNNEREGVRLAFAAEEQAVLVAQVAVASLGIDLTCASMAVFYSLDFSLVNHEQSRDRLHRRGQVNRVTYYYLLGEHTVDEAVYTALLNKQDLARSLLDLNRARQIFGGG